jgi:hypothetical protein
VDDDDGKPVLPLVMELITASRGDTEQFFRYGVRRLLEEKLSTGRVLELVIVLASFAGAVVDEWAAATDRTTDEVLQQIAMDMAQDGDA